MVRAPLPHRVVSRWWPQAERSDHGPFTRHGIRAFHLYHRGQDGDLIDLAYHSPRDVLARVDRASIDELGRLLRQLASAPLPAHGGDGFWVPVVANIVVPRWLLIAVELALAALALSGFGRVAWRGAWLSLLLAGAAIVVTTLIQRAATGDAWIHAPLAPVIGTALVLAGVLGLLAMFVRRVAPHLTSELAPLHHLVAIALPLAIGSVLLAIGAAELAWIWLVPAAASRLRIGILQVLPVALVLAPSQVREAVWNGFWPTGIPLAVWVGILGLPALAEGASFAAVLVGGSAERACFGARGRGLGPLGIMVLSLGCLLSMIAGVIVLFSVVPRCANCEIKDFDLTREVDR